MIGSWFLFCFLYFFEFYLVEWDKWDIEWLLSLLVNGMAIWANCAMSKRQTMCAESKLLENNLQEILMVWAWFLHRLCVFFPMAGFGYVC